MTLCAGRIAGYLRDAENGKTNDPLVIAPTPSLDALEGSGAASIDLRLGTWFVRLRQTRMSHLQVEDGVALPQLAKTSYVPFGGRYYLHPRTFVLGITLEWIRLPRNLTAYVIGRSSWGRRGLIIATATGVHPGFVGCLTLELTNVGETPIEIKPGMKICQIFLHEVDTTGSGLIDTSQFIGSRKPKLGDVKLDEVALKLAKGATGLLA
jgi:dCTP deaminase